MRNYQSNLPETEGYLMQGNVNTMQVKIVFSKCENVLRGEGKPITALIKRTNMAVADDMTVHESNLS